MKTIKPEEIHDNVFKAVGSDWMLITAGTLKSFNMMTASWGGFGILWHKNICWCVLRPQRHTR
ncbi:MAG: flavin reductase family protein, partial [Elusimicrobia bacterium]|nr:flavin reductase family protein [Elusimicrobiota bacterium]MBD3412779.1 flavin reductase family protein [Elusimicrobiota bacterium]